jgi:hypothetical protein
MSKKILALVIAILTLLLAGCHGGDTTPITENFHLKAIVKSNDGGDRLEVEVIESDYAFGIYIVHTSNAAFINAEGEAISPSDIQVGDTVEITYSGQVMMSYPPQIVALKVKKI